MNKGERAIRTATIITNFGLLIILLIITNFGLLIILSIKLNIKFLIIV